MHWLTTFSLRNRSLVALVIVAVVALGGVAITSLREELIPNINYPAVTIVTMEPGASPLDVERQITTPLEGALKGASGLKELDSYSNEGMSILLAQFNFGTNMKDAQAAVQQAVQRVQPLLPQDAQAPTVQAINFNDFPVVQLAVTSPLPPLQLGAALQGKVVPRLEQIDGVAGVAVSGLPSMRVLVRLRPESLMRYRVSPLQVLTTLQQANVGAPVGTVTHNGLLLPVRVNNDVHSLAALQAIPLGPATSGAPPVTLGDVATFAVQQVPPSALTRTNGKPSVGLAITKSDSGNIVSIADAVQKLIPTIKADLGGSASVTTVYDQAPYIRQSISSMWREGLLGAAFAAVVILLFLYSWRSTVVAGMSIPLSVIVALLLLWWRGDSLNVLTLGGLTIAIGRIIDDSIVVLENAYRHLQEGDDVRAAAQAATREVSGAITASTLTTVAVFLPLGFLHGIAAEFFRPFALTVTFALLASLLVALTVVPVLVTWLLTKRHVGHREAASHTRLQRAYLPGLRWAINHKALTLILAVVVFAGSMALVPRLKTNLFDSSKENDFTITQALPPGTDLSHTMAAATPVEHLLATTPGVRTYQVTAGSTGTLFGAGGGANASSSLAQFTVVTDPAADKSAIIARLRHEVANLRDVGQVAVSATNTSMGSSDIAVRIYGSDPTALAAANATVLKAIKTVAGLANVTSNLSQSRPVIDVTLNQAKAAAVGITADEVEQTLGLALNGVPAGSLPTQLGTLPATLALPTLRGNPVQTIASLPLATASGVLPLATVAHVSQVQAPEQITHTDGERTVTISATAIGANVGQTSNQIKAALTKVSLPAGTRWEMAGVTEQMNDVFRQMGIAMVIAILVVYLIMAGAFRSLLNPLLLLISIPFAAVGAVLMLWLTSTPLGLPSLIGLLMLIGIVVTNAIVLLDLINQFRRRGMTAEEAVIEGARRRLRPILMTAVATILALIPMALGPMLPYSWHLGESSFLSTPLAVVVIGGLFTSTVLTLVLVPVLYLSVERLRRHRGAPARHEDGASQLTG